MQINFLNKLNYVFARRKTKYIFMVIIRVVLMADWGMRITQY